MRRLRGLRVVGGRSRGDERCARVAVSLVVAGEVLVEQCLWIPLRTRCMRVKTNYLPLPPKPKVALHTPSTRAESYLRGEVPTGSSRLRARSPTFATTRQHCLFCSHQQRSTPASNGTAASARSEASTRRDELGEGRDMTKERQKHWEARTGRRPLPTTTSLDCRTT